MDTTTILSLQEALTANGADNILITYADGTSKRIQLSNLVSGIAVGWAEGLKDPENNEVLASVAYEHLLNEEIHFKQPEWVNVTYLNGWTTYSNYTPVSYQKQGQIVFMRGLGDPGTANIICNLPEGYRPEADIEFIPVIGVGEVPIIARIQSNGNVSLVGYEGVGWVSMSLSFLVA